MTAVPTTGLNPTDRFTLSTAPVTTLRIGQLQCGNDKTIIGSPGDSVKGDPTRAHGASNGLVSDPIAVFRVWRRGFYRYPSERGRTAVALTTPEAAAVGGRRSKPRAVPPQYATFGRGSTCGVIRFWTKDAS